MLSSIPGLVVARASEPPSDSALDPILQEYRRYLVEQLSLAAPTVRSYLGTARAFLSQLDRSVMLDLSALTAAEVRTFVVSECRRLSVGSSKLRVTGLRSLLRFLFQGGYTTRSLVGAAPAPSAMSGGYLPRGVAPEAVAALLSSCDCSTATGRRDFAVLTVLSRLGLRVGEVASLVLEDLDWHHGELLVRGKGGRQDRLPLPADVGEAVVAYLVDGRPRVDERTVFMRVHAPITGMSGSNVSRIVASACRRAGVPVVHGHRLRHTAATAMLASGASLAEIGQVLRQSRAATTAVYAKVDRVALRRLARPWPEVVA
jgi:site-specific recombinase XerD